MINSSSYKYQDTIQVRTVVPSDSLKVFSDSLPAVKPVPSVYSVKRIEKPVLKNVNNQLVDTTAVCSRNIVADVTFYNSNNIFTKSSLESISTFPYLLIEKNRKLKTESRESIIKYLKTGEEIPKKPLNEDWIIVILLTVSFLYSFIKTSSKGSWLSVIRFFFMRNINDPASRDVDSIFQWHSTINNLSSFMVTALFTYCAASTLNLLPIARGGLINWLIYVGIIIAAITIRHMVCVITGKLSGTSDVFKEYLVTIYQSYRFSALVLLVLVILMSYSTILPAKTFIIIGAITFSMMYIIRVLRLFMIFINRNISIFYLILYLCALEILPVLISVKYFTGLI